MNKGIKLFIWYAMRRKLMLLLPGNLILVHPRSRWLLWNIWRKGLFFKRDQKEKKEFKRKKPWRTKISHSCSVHPLWFRMFLPSSPCRNHSIILSGHIQFDLWIDIEQLRKFAFYRTKNNWQKIRCSPWILFVFFCSKIVFLLDFII